MVEYAVILALIAGTLVLAYTSLGETTLQLFNQVVSQL